MSKERAPRLLTHAAAAAGGLAVGYLARERKQRRRLRRAGAIIREAGAENKRLRHEVDHDSLTGALTKEVIKNNAERLKKAGIPFGVFLMDWDAFKLINDKIGHEEADEMLSNFGAYFARSFRREGEAVAHERIFQQPENADDTDKLFGRYGGDEFVMLVNLSDRGQPDGLTPTARMAAAEKYLLSVTEGFVAEQDQAVHDLQYGISVGGAMSLPGSSDTVSDTFKAADLALRLNKEARGVPVR